MDSILGYLGSICGGNERRHPSSWVDLRAGHGRDYGPVTVSMVERISGLPIVKARYLFDFDRDVCVILPSKKKLQAITVDIFLYIVKI